MLLRLHVDEGCVLLSLHVDEGCVLLSLHVPLAYMKTRGVCAFM